MPRKFSSPKRLAQCLLLLFSVGWYHAAGQSANCATVDPGNSPSQSGLYAEYYAGYFNDNLTYFTANAPGLQRIDSQLNFTITTWGNIKPPATGGTTSQPEVFSLRERGAIYLDAGTYTFYLTSDDASYLWVGSSARSLTPAASAATINNGSPHAARTNTGTFTAPTAGWYDLQVLYGDAGGGGNSLKLEYSSSTVTRQVIPSSKFCTGIRAGVTGLSYSPASQQTPVGTAVSSGTPTVTGGNGSTPTFTLNNASSLPAGITINSATGVLTADATTPMGSYSVAVDVTNTDGTITFADAYVFQVQSPACIGKDAQNNAASRGFYSEFFAGYYNSGSTDTDATLQFFSTNTPKLTAITSALNFTSSDIWHAKGFDLYTAGVATNTDLEPHDFSVRFRGQIYIATADTYTFTLTSDDGSYLFLDNAAVASPLTISSATIASGGQHAKSSKTGTATLTAGWHNILVLYGQGPSVSYLTLEYEGTSASNTKKQTVTSSAVCSTTSTTPLPVQLLGLTAQADGVGVHLAWATASELNSARFVIERSADGSTWTTLGQVRAAGSSAREQQYSFLDAAPLSLGYYRLRMEDQDGTTSFSPVALASRRSGVGLSLTLAPNPTTDGRLTAELNQPTAATAQLQVLDALGRVVRQYSLAASTTQVATLDLHALPAGVYVVRVVTATGSITQRVVRQ